MPSINEMAVCDEEMRFTNLVAKWHGSISLRLSHMQIHMKKKQQEGWFLGERGTPYRDTLQSVQCSGRKLSKEPHENKEYEKKILCFRCQDIS